MVTKMEWSKLCARLRKNSIPTTNSNRVSRVSLPLEDFANAFNMLMQLGEEHVWSMVNKHPSWQRARERVERVASAAVGSTPMSLMLAPNDLRLLVDALDAYERENKGLRTRIHKAFALIDASKHPDINAVYAKLEELLSI